MDYICKICNKKIESNKHFWSAHSLKISEYFEKFEARETLDGKKVLFKKDIEAYFETDFNNLISRNNWIKSNPEEGRTYLLNLLAKRKEKKGWKYAPGQSLLRLSSFPSILWFEKEFGKSFNDICLDLGLKCQYTNCNIKIDWESKIEIIQDTREQTPLKWPAHISVAADAVKYGDYIMKDNPKISIERKSLNDLVSTISTGYERFKKELSRAKQDKGYLVILCESSFNDFRAIEYLPQMQYSQVTYDHAAKRLRDLHEEFNNFQICFASGRKHAVKMAELILKLGKKVKKTDLQLLIDRKLV